MRRTTGRSRFSPALLAAAALAARCAAAPQLLYSLPEELALDNSSIVRVNPTSTPQDTTLVDFWRLGAGPLAPAQGWDLSAWTGASGLDRASQRGLQPSADVNGSTAMQFESGTFGASLNLFETPTAPPDTLGTITIENNWGPATQVAPWAPAAGALDLAVLYEAHSAFKTGVAVYSSWSLGLSHRVSKAFVWYETALFDLDRDLGGDEIWHDTISGNVIVHGVLGPPSAFHELADDSSVSSSSVWAGKRLFHFAITRAHIAAAIAAANMQFNITLGTDPSDWILVHFNVELEATPGARAAHSLQNLTISWTQ